MIVICEECGKKYQIDPAKIRGKQARFTCKSCGNPVTVFKPEEPPAAVEPAAAPSESPDKKFWEEIPSSEGVGEGPPPAEDRKKKKRRKEVSAPKGLGLRAKMMILFFVVPILCVAAAGWLYIQQLQDLSTLITDQSSEAVNKMAEELITLKAQTVARQAAIYFDAHPGLTKEQLNIHPEFRDIAVQKVGKTGYTAIYSIPDVNGVSSLWAHPNEKLIGVDLKEVMEKALGKGFDRFWKVYAGAFKGNISEGYYPWQDPDGKIREKFMVCVPVEKTPYVAPATTYLDEFTTPVKRLRSETTARTQATRNTIYVIVLATIVLIGVIVSFYGYKLTSRIQALTNIADRISVGELDAEIEVQSNDEIGDLGDAVSRMQDSIRLSIERLRKRG
jgi:HAMP domain-containing protein